MKKRHGRVMGGRYDHPGPLIREDLNLGPMYRRSITKLAPWLGVGRPALSRFLNGRSYASPKLACAIEEKLGIKAVWILEQQARHALAEYRSGG